MHGFFSRFLKKFPDSARTLRRTQTLTTVGLFLAIQMVLSSYGVIQLNDSLKISLAHLALAPTAMLFGPVAAALQGALSDILDEADPIESSYIFEVASAGAERPLKRPGDFEQFMGSPVLLKTYKPVDGRKEFSGDLAGYDNGAVTLRIGEEEKRFEKDAVALVRLRCDF